MRFKSLDRHCHCKISLTRSRRSDTHYNSVFFNSFYIVFLTECFSLNDLSARCNTYSAVSKLYRLFRLALINKRAYISNALFIYRFTFFYKVKHSLNSRFRTAHTVLLTAYPDIRSSAENSNAVLPLDKIYIFIETSEKCAYLVNIADLNNTLCHKVTSDRIIFSPVFILTQKIIK